MYSKSAHSFGFYFVNNDFSRIGNKSIDHELYIHMYVPTQFQGSQHQKKKNLIFYGDEDNTVQIKKNRQSVEVLQLQLVVNNSVY